MSLLPVWWNKDGQCRGPSKNEKLTSETASFNTTHQTIVVRVPSFASTFCICCSVAPKVTTTGLFAWKKKIISNRKFKEKKSLDFVETGLPWSKGCVIFATLWSRTVTKTTTTKNKQKQQETEKGTHMENLRRSHENAVKRREFVGIQIRLMFAMQHGESEWTQRDDVVELSSVMIVYMT